MNEPRDDHQLRVRCACGWERVAGVEDAVAAVMDHAQRVHNMTATREAVLAGAEWVEPA